MDTTEKLVDYCLNLRYEDLSDEAIDRVKYLFLDFIGLAYRGSTLESSQPIIDYIKEMGGEGEHLIFGIGHKTSPVYSCLANGGFSHSLELDDLVNEGSVHPQVVVFPAVIAMAEYTKASGKEMITASVLGYEVMIRLARALDPSEHYKKGFHPTGTCGTFAAAAVAAKLLNLNKEQFTSALGLCGSMAAASLQFLIDGAWNKRLHPGWAAHAGLTAAFLAARNFKGTAEPITGKFGFMNGYSDHPKPELVTKDIGDTFLLLKSSIKPHACCRYNQGPADSVIRIVSEHHLKPEDIKKIKVGMVKTALPLVADPIEEKRTPKSDVAAQFSMPFAAAAAVAYRKVSLEEVSMEGVQDPVLIDLMQKVDVYNDPELDKEFPDKWQNVVMIETIDGKEYEDRVEFPKGDPENPLSWEEIIEKFKDLVSPVISETQADQIVSVIRNFEQTKDALRLIKILEVE